MKYALGLSLALLVAVCAAFGLYFQSTSITLEAARSQTVRSTQELESTQADLQLLQNKEAGLTLQVELLRDQVSEYQYELTNARRYEDGYRDAIVRALAGNYSDGYEAAKLIFSDGEYDHGYHNAVNQLGITPNDSVETVAK